MPVEGLRGERFVVLIKTLNELEEFLRSGTDIDERMFNAISMLLVDATLSGDDKTLSEASKKLERMTLICKSGVKGRLLGYIDVVSWAQVRIIPKSILEQLSDVDNFHRRVLVALSHRLPKTRQDLCEELHEVSSTVEVALEQLFNAGLVCGRSRGKTYWEITPRGREALHLTRS